MRRVPLLVAVAAAALAGCATAPKPLQGEFSPVTPSQARAGGGIGEQVRWGGGIVSVRPLEEETCLEILARDLGRSGRPARRESDQGRFIACKPGFLDPASFKEEREVTVVGSVEGVKDSKIGEYEYRFPLLHASVVYLWPERSEYDRRPYYHDPFFYRPFYHPFYWPYPYRSAFWFHHHGAWPKAAGAGG